MKKNDLLVLKDFILKCNYSDEQKKYIYDEFGKKNVLCILRQIYASLGMLNDNENEYLQIFNFLINNFNLDCNILEIGCGNFPILATYIDRHQKNIGKGTITVIDPELSIKKHGNIKLIKDSFMFGDDISKYDLIISQSPCLKIDEVTAAAIEKKKNFFVTLCNCILERYPNLVDYYYDDESFDPIFEQLLFEMNSYNNYLNNSNYNINSGSLCYNYGEIKYFTGKKLIK